MTRQWRLIVPLLCVGFMFLACEEDEEDPTEEFVVLDHAEICDHSGTFTAEVDNKYFPLPVGRQWILEGEDDGESIRVEIEVLDQTEEVAGVTTRVVTETEYEDDELIEISTNFFAQAEDGTVCYFGEDVDDYEDGEVAGHEGAWRAGENENLAGIIMPADPTVETKFYQESAPEIAEDMSAIIGFETSYSVTAGTFEDVLHALDWNPLEGESGADGEDKYYAADIGLIVDDVVELISYSDS